MTDQGEHPPEDNNGSEYIVVLKARSAARFYPEEHFELTVAAPQLGLRSVRLRSFTGWVGETPQTLPRELIVEACGHAASLDEAVAKFSVLARPVATMAAFVANVRVGPLEVHLAYDCSQEKTERQFLEVFVPDEQGGVSGGRRIRPHLMNPACTALIGLEADPSRVNRALRQYELALREWYLGGEWLALGHLWIAAENLTKAVTRKTCADQGITERNLAHTYGVVTDDPKRPRWSEVLGSHIRRSVIFEGDVETYRTAREASDGLEHGFLELNEINAHALRCADKTFHYIRKTILSLLGLPEDVTTELLDIAPRDVQSDRKVVRGRLTGAADDPAEEGQLYPLIEWKSVIESFEREGENFVRKGKEHLTIRTHPNVGFHLDRLEVIGRLEAGEATIEFHDEDVKLEHTTAPKGPRLLDRVMPLVEAVLADAGETGYSLPAVLAFQLFSQGVASFQSGHALVRALQPIEALPSLRTLTLIAARFEQVVAPGGPGLGVVLRMALNSLAELGADQGITDARRTGLEAAAAASGVTIPDELPDSEETSAYRALGAEMGLAKSIVNGTYGAMALHLASDTEGRASFRTHIEPGPLTDLVSSASVIAVLTLLGHAVQLFRWELDGPRLDNLLSEALTSNEEAAQP